VNPALAIAMIAAGGGLLALAAIGFALGLFGSSAAIAFGVLGGVIDTLGAIAFALGRRDGRALGRR
jgi:hypothetical protein